MWSLVSKRKHSKGNGRRCKISDDLIFEHQEYSFHCIVLSKQLPKSGLAASEKQHMNIGKEGKYGTHSGNCHRRCLKFNEGIMSRMGNP
jgi:hypothetical protein